MKILAIDTASKACSVSLLEKDTILLEKISEEERTHSQRLMPMIAELLEEANTTLEQIEGIACNRGPGSFTGVRIGIATAKAFSDVYPMQVAGISALEGLAYNIEKDGYILSVIDAKHENVYSALYKREGKDCFLCQEERAETIEEMLARFSIIKNEPVVCVGDGSIVHKEKLQAFFPKAEMASEKEDIQYSSSIAKAALRKWERKEAQEPLIPRYLRKAQAERGIEQKEEKVQIERMTMQDLQNIKVNLQQDFDKFWNATIFAEELSNADSCYWVAKQEENIVAFAGYKKIVDEIHIMNIATRVDKRGRKIATQLFQTLIEEAKKQYPTLITLEVNESNIPAIKLYQNAGFIEVGRRKKYYFHRQDAIIMELRLKK